MEIYAFPFPLHFPLFGKSYGIMMPIFWIFYTSEPLVTKKSSVLRKIALSYVKSICPKVCQPVGASSKTSSVSEPPSLSTFK